MKLILALLLMIPLTSAHALSPQEAKDIATEAYIYLYPLLSMDVSRRQLTNIEAGKMPGRGPMNTISHMRAFPDANFREVVRPNFDTLYSSLWIDVSKEPVLITMPDTNGRYYLLPMLDMWTNVLGAPGARTSGTGAQLLAVIPPNWRGKLPTGATRIQATTPYLWMIGRIQTNGAADYSAVHAIQNKMSITPLSNYGRPPSTPPFKHDPSVDMTTPPLVQVNSMTAEKYFALGSQLMKLNAPHVTDWSQIARFKRIGLAADGKFDMNKLAPEIRTALAQGAAEGLQRMREKVPTLARVVNGWSLNTDTMGVYGNYYLKRAIVAMVGLGANQPEDAVYPLALSDSSGQPLVGEKNYVIHFEANEIPPNEAFWSLTMYDQEGFQVPNSINRFAIGDRDALKFNADGSLDIYIQHQNPGPDRESNWLPAPANGAIGLTMRIYAPKSSVLDGRWAPPAIHVQ